MGEYSPNYCLQLEAAYGKGMMSEGDAQAIELMFDKLPNQEIKALDIGSGLGGVAQYLAAHYPIQVTGIEVDPWMVEESNRRIPGDLSEKLNYILVEQHHPWPFSDGAFDLIYSKGVLTHLKSKEQIFRECRRSLNSEGRLVITDWLSRDDCKWGEYISRLVELEGLELHPESEKGYVKQLEASQFFVRSVRDDSEYYAQFNREVIKRLADSSNFWEFNDLYTSQELQEAIEGYTSIVKALETGELRVMRFLAT